MSLVIQFLIITFALTVHQCCGDCIQTGVPSGENQHKLGIVRRDTMYSCSLACQASKDCESWAHSAPVGACILFAGSLDRLEQSPNSGGYKVGSNCFCHLKEEARRDELYDTCVQYGRPSGFDVQNSGSGLQPSGFFMAHSVEECSDACRHASAKGECFAWAFNQKNNKCTLMILPLHASGEHLDVLGFEHIVIGKNHCFVDYHDPNPDSVECVSEHKIHMDGPDEEVVGGLVSSV